jgi:hypothetical protein
MDYVQLNDSTYSWQWGTPIPTSSQRWKGTTAWQGWLLCNVSILEIVGMSNSSVPFRTGHEIHRSILQHFYQGCSRLGNLIMNIQASIVMFGLLFVDLKFVCWIFVSHYRIVCFLFREFPNQICMSFWLIWSHSRIWQGDLPRAPWTSSEGIKGWGWYFSWITWHKL